jgi:HEAT repeat protein/DNA-directed RNA polymerase subunit RPC12/RpoP
MPVQVTCPDCLSTFSVGDNLLGKKIRCRACESIILVKAGAKRPPTAIQEEAPARRPAAPAARRRGEDDEDDRPAPRRKGPEPSRGLPVGLLVGGGIGLLVFLGLVVGGIYWMMKSAADVPASASAPVAQNQPQPGGGRWVPPADAGNPAPVQPTVVQPPPETKKEEPKATPPAPKNEPVVFGGRDSGDLGQRVYKRLLKSTVLVLVPRQAAGGGISLAGGSGSLIDAKNRLMLTNAHVVQNNTQVIVFFPTYKEGRMITEKEHFLKQAGSNEALTGKVLFKDAQKDLAVVQLDRLPPAVEALPLAPNKPQVGEIVYSVGHPGAGGGLWVYTEGRIRQFLRKHKWRSGTPDGTVTEHEVDVVLTNSATNPGDSGGPLVNRQAEIVAVVQGGHQDANLMSIFVDVGEVREVLEQFSRRTGTKLNLPTATDLPAADSSADVVAMMRALRSDDAKTRSEAAQALGNVGPAAKIAVPDLLKACKDSDEFVRRFALDSLKRIGPPAPGDVGQLAGALDDTNVDVRLYAVEALSKMGADAQAGAPVLVKALRDTDARVRQNAALALGKIGAAAREQAVPALADVLKDKDKSVRVAAAESLTAGFYQRPGDAPKLLELLKHDEPEVRAQAARGLGRLGRSANAAAPPLTAAAQDKEPAVRQAALEALPNVTPPGKELVALLQKALKDSDNEVRKAAIDGLGKCGAEAKPAVPGIADALKEADLRKNAIAALTKLGPNAREAAPALADLLGDVDWRAPAAGAIAAVHPSGYQAQKQVVPKLIRVFEQEEGDQQARDKAADALAKIGTEALPSVTRALENNNRWVRLGAANTLGKMGSSARSAAKRLEIHAAGDSDPEVQKACSQALNKVR